MKRVVGAFVGVAALGAIAFGSPAANADGIPRGAAAAPVYAAPYNWGGWYLGGSAGWMRTDFDWAFSPPLAGAPNQAFSLSDDGAVFGGHFGVQGQWSNVVLGIEAGWTGSSDIKARHDGFGVGSAAFAEASLHSLYTVGPRLGWAMDNWLLYVTGGYANGRVLTGNPLKTTGFASITTAQSHDGWYIGAGAEWALTRNWILGVEYLHVDLDSDFHCTSGASPCGVSTNNHTIDPNVDIVRARLSFKFGREPEAVPLK